MKKSKFIELCESSTTRPSLSILMAGMREMVKRGEYYICLSGCWMNGALTARAIYTPTPGRQCPTKAKSSCECEVAKYRSWLSEWLSEQPNGRFYEGEEGWVDGDWFDDHDSDDAEPVSLTKTIFGRTPVGHVLIDPHGDPWVRVPGGAVEVVMRPSNGGPPVRIFHPTEDFAECEEEFGPFTEVEDA